ncbi:MAG: MTAP family purine nucleoside phosphorylase [Thermodesulfobacteriota bacterium]|nr:MTAP family purine nucleoside phosphorylase [Thermodesulfobacteriota bacterium]
MTTLIGLVAGTVFYQKDYFKDAEKKEVQTKFGPAVVFLTRDWAYVPRHGLEGEQYVPAHKINYPANFSALKELGIVEVIGVNSAGSLRPSLEPGTIVLPHDYISLSQVATVFDDYNTHITPQLSHRVREKLIVAAKSAGIHMVEGGVYWQNQGPRLETKSEIRFQSHYADMVGMSMASEATVAQELGLEYASLCSVDNHAHGLSPTPLTEKEIMANAAANAERMFKVIQACLNP